MLVLPVITDGISEMLRAAHCGQSWMDSADLFDAIIMPHVLMQSLSENTSQAAETQKASGSDNMTREGNGPKSTEIPPKSTENGNNGKPTENKDFNQANTNPADFLETLIQSFFENYQQSTEQNGCNKAKESGDDNAKSTESTAGSSKSSDDGNNKPKSCGGKHFDSTGMSPADFFEALMQSVTETFQVTPSDGKHQHSRSDEANGSNNETDDNTNSSEASATLNTSVPPNSSENDGNNKPQNSSDNKFRHPCMNPADFFEALNIPHMLLQSLSENSKQSTSAEPQKPNGCNAKTCNSTVDNNDASVEANTKSDDIPSTSCEENTLKSSDNDAIVTPENTSKVDNLKSSENNNDGVAHNVKPSEYSNENSTQYDNEKSANSIENSSIKSSDHSSVKFAEEAAEDGTSKSSQLNKNNIETQSFQVSLDVQQFKPEEITIKLSGESVITVEGKHEEMEDEHGSISRHFVRRYTIPAGYDSSKIISKLSSDGVLTILVPKIVKGEYFEVPIVQTGLAASNYKHMI